MMAIGGSAGTAYRVQVSDGQLLVGQMTKTPREYCASVDDAVARLERGEQVTVSAVDLIALRRELERRMAE